MSADPLDRIDPFARNPNLSRLAILFAALALLLAVAMPLLFHMRIHGDHRARWELMLFLIYLSSMPAFVLAGRRPFAGALWLLAIAASIGAWLVSQVFGPFYAEMLLTPNFFPADLPAIGGLVFLLAAWVTRPPASTRRAWKQIAEVDLSPTQRAKMREELRK